LRKNLLLLLARLKSEAALCTVLKLNVQLYNYFTAKLHNSNVFIYCKYQPDISYSGSHVCTG